MPLVWVTLLVAGLVSCGKPPAPVFEYRLTGNVLQLDGNNRTALISHEKIEGWMEAMTMEFPVKDEADWKKLRPGLRIHAKVLHQPDEFKYWIADVRAATTGPAGP